MRHVRLKPQRFCRALTSHPWAFAGEIETPRAPIAAGEGVELRDATDRPLGSGIWSNSSQIAWRRYSRETRPFDAEFAAGALAAAVARRGDNGRFRRLVWSEADNLPGLVVELFADVLVAQALTAGADRLLPEIVAWLRANLAPREIILRNDAPVRARDGLPLNAATAGGADFPPEWFSIDGIEYHLDLLHGQKTGFYLDQREQHTRIAAFAKGRRVLDCFCNQGGFGLQAARAGAASVLALDSSAECAAAAARNAERNGFAGVFKCERANVFDWFTRQRDARGTHDLVILDPPPFAKSKGALDGALRGYKEINLRAMKLLAPGGILATYSCSQRVGAREFLEVLEAAAADCRRETRLLEITGQPPDHPVLLNFPESHYLKGAILQVA